MHKLIELKNLTKLIEEGADHLNLLLHPLTHSFIPYKSIFDFFTLDNGEIDEFKNADYFMLNEHDYFDHSRLQHRSDR